MRLRPMETGVLYRVSAVVEGKGCGVCAYGHVAEAYEGAREAVTVEGAVGCEGEGEAEKDGCEDAEEEDGEFEEGGWVFEVLRGG